MTYFQFRSLSPSLLLQTGLKSAILLAVASLFILTTSCSDDDKDNDEPVIQGVISSYNEFGAAMLDFTEADMAKVGFTLGDVSVSPSTERKS